MSGPIRVWLDETPGETRAVIQRDGAFDQILFERPDEPAAGRLGAQSVGRVTRLEPGLGGAFVDIGLADQGFMPGRAERLAEGQKLRVEVTAERREDKGVTLKALGPATGEVGLIQPAPSIRDWLATLAPGAEPEQGRAAIEAGWAAIDEAESRPVLPSGLTVSVERTRALVAVDLDHSPRPGRALDGRGRARLNAEGLSVAARLIRLRRLAGLVVIDLVGTGHDGKAVTDSARAAFGTGPGIVFGPVTRFGVLELALPWRWTPLDEVLGPADSARRLAQEAVRRLHHALLSDTTRARIVLSCAPTIARLAAPLVASLGPRAHIQADAGLSPIDLKIS